MPKRPPAGSPARYRQNELQRLISRHLGRDRALPVGTLKRMIGVTRPDLAILPKWQCLAAFWEAVQNPDAKPVNPNDDAFLSSYEWRKVRMIALKHANGRCECCGNGPKEGYRLNVDHIKPRRKYPELALDPDNLQVLCEACNHGKGNWDETDWRTA